MSPNKLQYRNYRQFEAHLFLQDVRQLPKTTQSSFTEWEKDFLKILNKYAPLKT